MILLCKIPLIMKNKLSVFCLFTCGIVCCLAQDVSQKSLKASDAAKLTKKQIAAKPAALLKKNFDDYETVTVDISDLGITVPPEDVNDTIITDHHTYYNSTFYTNPNEAKRFWIDLNQLSDEIVVKHDRLSDSHRHATTVHLSFAFPFYGNLLKNITVATGGFLYMGDYLHNWIAATQYVAPLMANFDTSISTNSNIKFADNGTAFTVLWENIFIQDRQSDGAFTFEVTLLINGDIIFAYKDIPYSVSTISSDAHPVKIGLSDAYILERTVYFIRRKTVYEYHRVHITDWETVSNNTALYFKALPTCNTFKTCSSCLSMGAKLECNWCEAINRCSDGIDRQRQSWVAAGCTTDAKVTSCPQNHHPDHATEPPYTTDFDKTEKPDISVSTKVDLVKETTSTTAFKPASNAYTVDPSIHSNDIFESNEEAHFLHEEKEPAQSSVSPGAIATILLFLSALIAAGVWIGYAYKFPQSSSGQFLIKYRPSQWVLNKESSVPTSNSRHL